MNTDWNKSYLGDGVYAEFDGFSIWLRAESPDSEFAICLAPDVIVALNRFFAQAKQDSIIMRVKE